MNFGQTAQSLARNPLGIIALFIVLIYGIAGLVFGVSSAHLEADQKWPLIWFLVLFPPLVLFAFVWLVANHSPKLYAPSDFRDDESFVRLNEKVSAIELRQSAVGVDPRGDSDTALITLEALLEAEQNEVAKNLANAFLKVRRYEMSLKMFERILDYNNTKSSGALGVLQYRAYCLIGIGRYEEAVQDLETLRATGNKTLFDFWPQLALAYCQMKLGNDGEFDVALRHVVTYERASEYQNMVSSLYPELATFYAERLNSSRTDSHP